MLADRVLVRLFEQTFIIGECMRYVALVRGVNVLGTTMIKMSELKGWFEALGFIDVVTYINSGNVAFDCNPHLSKGSTSRAAETKLVEKIESTIEKRLGKKVQVMLRDRAEIKRVIARNPFDGAFETHKQMHVFFMREEMFADKQEELLALQTAKERLAVRGREIYALLLDGFAESLLGRGLIERKLKVAITVRNWRTVEKLAVL